MPKPTVAALVLVALAAAACSKASGLAPEDAKRLVQSGARLVDVRTPEEFSGGHIGGAINIPVDQLATRLAELEPKNQPIVLYCHSGRRSGIAQETLKQAGFTNVHNLGAMSRWE